MSHLGYTSKYDFIYPGLIFLHFGEKDVHGIRWSTPVPLFGVLEKFHLLKINVVITWEIWLEWGNGIQNG